MSSTIPTLTEEQLEDILNEPENAEFVADIGVEEASRLIMLGAFTAFVLSEMADAADNHCRTTMHSFFAPLFNQSQACH